jgi:DNA integrity scanning protein DisA with diadenylate cyclase activity
LHRQVKRSPKCAGADYILSVEVAREGREERKIGTLFVVDDS